MGGGKLRSALRGATSLLAIATVSITPAAAWSQQQSTYSYDERGRLISQTDSDGTYAQYAYDAAGNRTLVATIAPPVGAPATLTVAYNSTNNTVPLGLSGGAATSVTVSTQASHGTATANGISITYTPTSGYFGSDSFQYTVTNSTATSAPATVSITVNPQSPTANPISVPIAYNSVNNVIPLNITGGAPASVAVIAQAAHGTATANGTTITYTPTNGYGGPDSFTYTASNAGGTSAAATASLTIAPAPPTANNSSATVAYGSSNNQITPTLTGGPATSVAVSSQPGHGSASANGLNFLYTPSGGYSGSDSFTYTASNQTGTSNVATFTITVNPQRPVANNVSATVAYGSTNNPITLNTSGGGAAASVAVSTQATHGTATANGTSITYTPTSGYSGSDNFQYTASNAGGTSSPGTVSITVNPQPPIANSVSKSVYQGTSNNAISLNITGGTPTSVAVSTQAAHGTATANGMSITYTPTGGYVGSDSFLYTASNAGGTSAAATVSVTVNSSAPTAQSDSYTSTSSTATLNVLQNDSSPVGYPLTIISVTQPANGSASISNNQISFTDYAIAPDIETFTYTISDGHGGTSTATVKYTLKCSGACQ